MRWPLGIWMFRQKMQYLDSARLIPSLFKYTDICLSIEEFRLVYYCRYCNLLLKLTELYR